MSQPTPRIRRDPDYDAYVLSKAINEAIAPLADQIKTLQGATYDKGYLDQRFTQLERDIRDLKDSWGKAADRAMTETERNLAKFGGLIGVIGGVVAILHYVHF